MGSTANIIFANGSSSLTHGIIQGGTVTDATSFASNTSGFNLATYGANGVAALTTYQTLSTTGGNTASDNVLVTSSTALTSSDTVNAVLFVGDGINISGGSGISLTVGSGMVASTGGTSTGDIISVPSLVMSVEGVVVTNNGSPPPSSSSITGSNGLTVAGGGTTALSGTNAYTGTTTLDSGILAVGTLGAIPTASPLALTGGTIEVASTFRPGPTRH